MCLTEDGHPKLFSVLGDTLFQSLEHLSSRKSDFCFPTKKCRYCITAAETHCVSAELAKLCYLFARLVMVMICDDVQLLCFICFVCVEVLWPSQPNGVIPAQSVYLITCLLGRLSPLSG